MKRIYISLAFIIIVAVIAAVQFGLVSATADVFSDMIEQSDNYMRRSNFSDAARLCKTVENEWDESAKKIDMLLIHDYVDDIGNNISMMTSYAENGNRDMYFAESSKIKKELASIRESEHPYIENIL